MRLAARCRARGGARGILLEELEAELATLLPGDAYTRVNARLAPAALAYRQVP